MSKHLDLFLKVKGEGNVPVFQLHTMQITNRIRIIPGPGGPCSPGGPMAPSGPRGPGAPGSPGIRGQASTSAGGPGSPEIGTGMDVLESPAPSAPPGEHVSDSTLKC